MWCLRVDRAGEHAEARKLIEEATVEANAHGDDLAPAHRTALAYNLARLQEAGGELTEAARTYEVRGGGQGGSRNGRQGGGRDEAGSGVGTGGRMNWLWVLMDVPALDAAVCMSVQCLHTQAPFAPRLPCALFPSPCTSSHTLSPSLDESMHTPPSPQMPRPPPAPPSPTPQEILAVQPDYIDCYLRLACVARAKGAIATALEWARKALSRQGGHTDALALISQLHMERREYQQADTTIRQLNKAMSAAGGEGKAGVRDSYGQLAMANLLLVGWARDGWRFYVRQAVLWVGV